MEPASHEGSSISNVCGKNCASLFYLICSPRIQHEFTKDSFNNSSSRGPVVNSHQGSTATWISLILFSLLIALSAHWYTSFQESPLFDSPAIDEALHLQWVTQLAEGEGSPEIPYFRAPLHLWLLSLPARLDASPPALRLVSTLLSLINLLLLGQLGRRYLRPEALPWLMLLSLLAAAWTFFAPMLLIVHGLIFWLLLGTHFYLLAVSKPRRAPPEAPGNSHRSFLRSPLWPTLIMPFAAGLSLGLASISRPNALLLLPLLWGAIALHTKTKTRWKPVLSAFSGSLLPLLLVAGINGFPGSGVFIASQGGVNFWIGNNPHADGRSATLPETGNAWERSDAKAFVAQSIGHAPTPAEESNFYMQRSLKWIQQEPIAWAKLLLLKSGRLLRHEIIGNNTNPLLLSVKSPWLHLLLPASWLWILIPGVIALILGYPHNTQLRHWNLGILLIYSLSIILFFCNERFRLPLYPFLILPAADFLADLGKRWNRRYRFQKTAPDEANPPLQIRPTQLALIVLFLLGTAVAEWTIPSGDQDFRRGWHAYQEGNAWQRLGQFEKAKISWKAAVEAAPSLGGPRLNQGLLHAGKRENASAMYFFQQEIALGSSKAEAHNAMGALYLAGGHRDRALEEFEVSLELRPGLQDARFNLGLCLSGIAWTSLSQGDSTKARLCLERVLLESTYRGKKFQMLQTGLAN
jgi:tetratricopeptide (TPR) repeat protein